MNAIYFDSHHARSRLRMALFRSIVAFALSRLSHQIQQDLACDKVLSIPSVVSREHVIIF